MLAVQCWSFGAFRLDVGTICLWRDEQLLPLPPKPLAVLAYLVARAGQVITKDELLEAVWPETIVSEGVLKTCLAQIRRVLGETAQAPQYIATVHRRGYRFMAPVTVQELLAPIPEETPEPCMEAQTGPTPPALLVARQAEMTQLHQRWTQALHVYLALTPGQSGCVTSRRVLPPGGEVVRSPRHYEPQPSVATAMQVRRSPTAPRRGLYVVH